MNHKQIKIIIVEDEILLRKSIEQIVRETSDQISICGFCENGKEALELVKQYRPNIVITDIRMPIMDGMELIRQIKSNYPAVKVVVLSGYDDFSYTKKAIKYGVFNYLLKPVNKEELSETLLELQNELLIAKETKHRNMICSEEYEVIDKRYKKVILIHICIGNLCIYTPELDELNLFDGYDLEINWRTILNTSMANCCGWYMTNETMVNQKTICYIVDNDMEINNLQIGEKIQCNVQQYFPGIPITVCISRHAYDYEETWMAVQRMRNVVKLNLVIGKGKLFCLEDMEYISRDEIEPIKLRINYQLHQHIKNANKSELKKELLLIYNYMIERDVSETDIIQMTQHILRMMDYAGVSVGNKKDLIVKSLILAVNVEKLPELIVKIIMECYGEEEIVDISYALKEYIDKNFLVLHSLEQLATVFNYRYEYLCRKFKETHHVAMSTYLTQKKIDLAITYMKKNPEMSISDISTVLGYEDRRYFTRIFKTYTGQTPSEFKKIE